MTDSWLLPSNDGWNKFTGKIIEKRIDSNYESIFLVSISIEGSFWQRNKQVKYAELHPDFLVHLPQVNITETALKNLIDSFEQWLMIPYEFSIELSGVEFQSLLLNFCVDKNYICSIDKPVCKIQYSAERMSAGEWNFIVDQSCIRLFKEDLDNIKTSFCR